VPNPAKHRVQIKSGNTDIHEIKIFSMTGEHIKTIILKADRANIDISG